MQEERQREMGIQPLDQIMTDLEIQNSDLVMTDPAGMTHKMVRRGRKGRWLTKNSKKKILTALNLCLQRAERSESFVSRDLFNYDEK